jgi:hypothetical protein
MRRILQIESDSLFLHTIGAASLKTFFQHNKGWELFVADIGLTPEDRKILERYGEVKQFKPDIGRRWLHQTARMRALVHTVRDNNLVLRVDTDSIFFRNYDKLIDEFAASDDDMFTLPLPFNLHHRFRNLKKVQQFFGYDLDDTAWLDQPVSTTCFMIVKGTPKMEEAFQFIADNEYELKRLFKDEEPAMNAAYHYLGVKLSVNDWIYFWTPSMYPSSSWGYSIPSPRPAVRDGRLPYAAHFAYNKYHMTQFCIQSYDVWNAWKHRVINPAMALPWPDQEVTRGHSR